MPSGCGRAIRILHARRRDGGRRHRRQHGDRRRISALLKPLPVTRPTELRFIAWSSARHPFVNGPNVLAGVGHSGSRLMLGCSRDARRLAPSPTSRAGPISAAVPVVLGELRDGAPCQFVSGRDCRTLGVPAALGRTIPADEPPGGVVAGGVIGHRFWIRTFAAISVTRQTRAAASGRPGLPA